jgi:hypothetical protein
MRNTEFASAGRRGRPLKVALQVYGAGMVLGHPDPDVAEDMRENRVQ